MHKAKGLEWDVVYLLSVSNYDFPSLDPYDSYYAEKFFIRNNLNLQEETLSQLDALIVGDMDTLYQPEGAATVAAREGIAEERLRLLYVGITRARKELFILFNTGTFKKNVPAKPYLELAAWWEEVNHAAST
jgi:DNA helicase-2/ATP-dependent DNA helicase PcrA